MGPDGDWARWAMGPWGQMAIGPDGPWGRSSKLYSISITIHHDIRYITWVSARTLKDDPCNSFSERNQSM